MATIKIRLQGIKSKYTKEYIFENTTIEKAYLSLLTEKSPLLNGYKYIGLKVIKDINNIKKRGD